MHQTSSHTFSSMSLALATPLEIAAALGECDIARSLIESGASVDGVNEQFSTPLHFAAIQDQTQVIGLLVHSGANPNAVDSELGSPCMYAARCGFLDPIQALIEGGADPTLQDKNGRTALFHAACYWHYNIVVFLINTMKKVELGAEIEQGLSVLSIILSWSGPPIQSFLLNLAPNPSAYEPHQGNVLVATVKTNNPVYLKRLLRRLPKELIPRLLTHRTLRHGTPLYAAATYPSENAIHMLLDAGADLELEGGDHGTPLMGACAAGRLEVVKVLVGKGAKTSYTQDGELFSVLSAARLHPKVTRWLLVGRFTEGPLLIGNGTI